MSFNVIRFEKIKSSIQIRKMEKHNFREMEVNNANKELNHLNKYFNKDKDHNTMFKELQRKYGFKVIEKGKNESVKLIEFVISASSDFFINLSKSEIEKYFFDNISILQNEFFKVDGSLISYAFHFDETTPHAHVVLCPIVKKNDRYTLSCKELFGGYNKCKNLQDIVFERLRERGWEVKRGVSKTRVKHQTIKDYYAMLNNNNNVKIKSMLNNVLEFMNEVNILNSFKLWLARKNSKDINNNNTNTLKYN